MSRQLTRPTRKMSQRPPKPALGRGRLEVAARRVPWIGDGTTTTAIAASYGYARKLHQGRGLTPRDYEAVRRALRSLGAVPVGRVEAPGRRIAVHWVRRWVQNNGATMQMIDTTPAIA